VAKILIVEDTGTVAEAMSALLRGAGHETRVTSGAMAALAEEDRFVPDAVLLDVRIPGAFELVRQLRERRGKSIRLVACTSFERERIERQHLLTVGFDAALGTPFFLADMNKALGDAAS
jgi:two-component system, NtrC family, response regulator AtoC